MAYYIMCEKKRGQYVALDIQKSEMFTRKSRFVGNGCSLEEIDMFTSLFNDYNELINRLYKEGIIDANSCDKPLSIRMALKDGVFKKVMYDFLFQRDFDYIHNPQELINNINNRLLSKDFRFVLEFASHFFNYYDCRDIAPEIRYFANDSIVLGQTNHHFSRDVDENGDKPLIRMVKQLIYEYDRRNYGRITYSKKIKYRNLHDIIAFCDYYDDKILAEKMERKQNSKTRTLKKEQKLDQISFFDEK